MSERSKSLDQLQASLAKTYGDRSVMYVDQIPAYDVFSSGSLGLDYATGINGFPTNRVIELAGAPGAGKTTLALHAVNNRIKFDTARGDDRGVVYIDQENRLTPDWVSNFVESPEKVIIVKPDTMEEVTDIYAQACRSGSIGMVVVDSIGGAPSQRVTDKSATSGNVGGNALAVTRFSQFATGMSGKYDVTTIGINQIRQDMDGFNRLITPGGEAWKHACSLRVWVKVGQGKVFDKIHGEELQVGYTVQAKIVKNSLGVPHRTAWWWFYTVQSKFGFGVDWKDEVVRIGFLVDAIEKKSSVMYHHPVIGDVRGKDNMIEEIKNSPEALDQIRQVVLEKMSSHDVHGLTGVASGDNDLDFGEDGVQGLGKTLAEAVKDQESKLKS